MKDNFCEKGTIFIKESPKKCVSSKNHEKDMIQLKGRWKKSNLLKNTAEKKQEFDKKLQKMCDF